MKKTAHVIIWGFGSRTSCDNFFNLIDGDLQTWRGGPPMDIFLDAPLANLFGSYLLRDGALDPVLNGDPDDGELKLNLYRRLSGYDVTVLRYHGCAITDEEIAEAKSQGVLIQVVDLETTTAGSIDG
jgi:hypothetical protein